MSYRELISKQVAKAFDLLKDLAIDVTLLKKTSETFNFGTAEMANAGVESLVTKAVWLEDEKLSRDHNSIKRQMLFKTKGIGDVKLYDRVLIDDLEWRIGTPILDDGFTLLADLYRKV